MDHIADEEKLIDTRSRLIQTIIEIYADTNLRGIREKISYIKVVPSLVAYRKNIHRCILGLDNLSYFDIANYLFGQKHILDQNILGCDINYHEMQTCRDVIDEFYHIILDNNNVQRNILRRFIIDICLLSGIIILGIFKILYNTDFINWIILIYGSVIAFFSIVIRYNNDVINDQFNKDVKDRTVKMPKYYGSWCDFIMQFTGNKSIKYNRILFTEDNRDVESCL
jgi:hypothetical protein